MQMNKFNKIQLPFSSSPKESILVSYCATKPLKQVSVPHMSSSLFSQDPLVLFSLRLKSRLEDNGSDIHKLQKMV